MNFRMQGDDIDWREDSTSQDYDSGELWELLKKDSEVSAMGHREKSILDPKHVQS